MLRHGDTATRWWSYIHLTLNMVTILETKRQHQEVEQERQLLAYKLAGLLPHNAILHTCAHDRA